GEGVKTGADLFQVILAEDSFRAFLCLAEDREKHGRQDADDGDDDEHFHEGIRLLSTLDWKRVHTHLLIEQTGCHQDSVKRNPSSNQIAWSPREHARTSRDFTVHLRARRKTIGKRDRNLFRGRTLWRYGSGRHHRGWWNRQIPVEPGCHVFRA